MRSYDKLGSMPLKKRLSHLLIGLVIVCAVVIVGVYPILEWYFPLKYRQTVMHYAVDQQLDPLLITSVMRVESRFDPTAVSPKGARGLMQIMPETGAWAAEQMGLEDFTLDRLFDPEINIAIGVWYLGLLKRQFDGDEVLAVAAYNGGRTNVLRWLDEGVWSGHREAASSIPFPETRGYVQKVFSTYDWYQRVWRRSTYGSL